MNISRIVAIACFCLLMAASAQAQMTGQQLYAGVKVGQMLVDVSGFDDATNIGVLLGMPVNDVEAGSLSGTFALEGELTFSAIEGDISLFGFNGDWDILTLAGYGAYRTNGQLYLKGKAGFLYEDISVDVPGIPGGVSGDDFGLSLGIGGGYRIDQKSSLELEFTIVESDINFLSIGYNINF